jgi:hypothetical protein
MAGTAAGLVVPALSQQLGLVAPGLMCDMQQRRKRAHKELCALHAVAGASCNLCTKLPGGGYEHRYFWVVYPCCILRMRWLLKVTWFPLPHATHAGDVPQGSGRACTCE